MEKLGLLALFLTLFCGLVCATNSNGVLYPFEINEQLVCHERNPFSNVPGEPASRPSRIPRIPFDVPIPNRNTVPESQIWLPQESG